MADKKISQLTALSAANVASATDVLAIVDTSATETKKITAKDLIDGALNGGTANGVLYLNGSKVATSGSALTFDGTNFSSTGTTTVNSGNSSSVGLVVKGETGNGIRQNFIGQASSGQYNWQIGASIVAAGTFSIIPSTAVDGSTFTTAALVATGTGNIGIGTTSPGEKLNVVGGNNTTSTVNFTGGSNNDNATIASDYSLVFQVDANNTVGGRVFNWRYGGNGYEGGTSLMTLDASGRLGVGVTSPDSMVEVNSSTAAYARFKVNYNGSALTYLGSFSGIVGSGNATDTMLASTGVLAFGAGGTTERARITSGGITLFGKTNDYSLGTQPGYVIASGVLSVASDNTASANNRNWAMLTNGYENGSLDFVSSSANNTWANDAYRMSVTRAGSTYNTTGTYGTLTSDERLKQDIADASSQWDDMKAIRFRKFRMKAEVAAEGDDAVVRLGVIAQEAAATSPNLVTRRVANENDIRVVPELEGQEVLGFKDSVMFWKAAKALQEAMARIEQLEADMAALKASA